MARNRASRHPRGAQHAPRVGISAGSRRFDTPGRVAFKRAANDNRSTGRARRLGIALAVATGVAVIVYLLAL